MPTYEYKNIETGEIYEFKQSMRDDALTHHPETGAAIKRIVSMPAIAFKGSGFYANDSRASTSSVKPTGAKAENPPGKESSGKESGGGESSTSSKTSDAGSSGSSAASSSSAPSTSRDAPKPAGKSSSGQGGE
ncbi:FmdB family zinc ribbon protein [Deinococcus altitudinis]|uniref:FmdB family zinc ribbon protein n=1 Tax=Deinococcus altitudinis TaxID=468914 RepID=UPI0038917B72